MSASWNGFTWKRIFPVFNKSFHVFFIDSIRLDERNIIRNLLSWKIITVGLVWFCSESCMYMAFARLTLRNMVGWLKRTVCWLDRFLLVWNFRFYGTFVRTVRSVLVKRNLPKDIFAHTRIGNGEGLKDWLRLTISLICSDFFLFFFSETLNDT